MRAKRQKDRKAIASFQQGRQKRQEGLAGPAPGSLAPQKKRPEEEEEEENAGESVEVWEREVRACRGLGPAALGAVCWAQSSPWQVQWFKSPSAVCGS
jgi:ATP-dependent RNA helicase DDX54/DBP10